MRTRPSRPLRVTAAALAVGATAAACSAGTAPSSHPSTRTGTASSSAAAGQRAGRSAGRAAAGTIAAVTGSTMQVQSQQDGQVAVRWTAATKFIQQVSVAAGSLKAGECVTAIASSGTSSTAGSFAASTISISTPANGSCTGGRDGQFRAGSPRPSGTRSGATRPPGASTGDAGNRAAPGAIARGTVVSVSGNTLVVAAREFGSGTSSPSTTNKTVIISSTTEISSEKSATASAVKVGRCASAQGSADSSGMVTATNVAITDPVSGECGRFGGFGRTGGSDTAGGNGG